MIVEKLTVTVRSVMCNERGWAWELKDLSESKKKKKKKKKTRKTQSEQIGSLL